jgi:PKD repeat protein
MCSPDLATLSFRGLQSFKKAVFTLFLLTLIAAPLYAQFGTGKIIYSAGGSNIPEHVLPADFDGDGDIDVMTKNMFSNPIFWRANDGNGTFSGTVALPGSNFPRLTSLKAIDYDKDGDQDVVASYNDSKKCLLWTNTGTGNFSAPITLVSNQEDIVSLYIIDYDKDGDQDIAVATKYDQPFWLENNRANNTWTRREFDFDTIGADFFEIVDITNDGMWEIFTLVDNGGGLLLNGEKLTNDLNVRRSAFIKASDVDRDGDLDLIVANKDYEGGIVWVENNNGTFTHHLIENSSGRDYRAGTVFDYDGDGDEDIFAGCWFDCGTDIYENLGAGNFKRIPSVSGGAVTAQEITHADINGDDRLDLVQNSASVHVVYWTGNNAEQFQGIEASFVKGGSCVDQQIKFNHTARGKKITQWTWNFGDGTPFVTTSNAVHKYDQAGIYRVKLTVTNDQGQSHTAEQTIEIHAMPQPLDDMVIKYCTADTTVTLPDSEKKFYWYLSSDPLVAPYRPGNEFTFNGTFGRMYVAFEDKYGCTSPRSKITAEKQYTPPVPTLHGASSFSGPANLVLKAEPWHGYTMETYLWRNEAGEIVSRGEFLKQWFDKTTTFYVQAQSSPGCVSYARPVTAYVYDSPIPPPTFTWADATQSTATTYPQAVASDNDGNIVVVAHWGLGDFKAGSTTLPQSGQYYDHAIVKYNMAGDVLDVKKIITGNQYSYSPYTSLFIDTDNYYYLTTEIRDDSFLFAGVLIQPPTTNETYSFLGKTDANGVYQWHKIVKGSAPRTGVTFDFIEFRNSNEATFYKRADGQFVVANPSSGMPVITVSDQKGVDVTANHVGPGVNSVVYVKNHQAIWVKDFVTNGNNVRYQNLALDNAGDIILAGSAEQDTPRNPFLMVGTQPVGNGPNFITKVSAEGNVIWAKSLGETTTTALVTDKQNNIFIATRTVVREYIGNTLIISDAYAVMKFNSEGKYQWTKSLSGGKVRTIKGLVPDHAGNVVVYGFFENKLELDQITLHSATSIPNGNNENIFIAKLGEVFKADFNYVNGCAGQATKFTDWSVTKTNNPIVSWKWSFGNGQTSTDQHPATIYAGAGSFDVSLEVKNSLGEIATVTKKINIVNIGPAPLLGLTPNKASACQAEVVTYQASVENVDAPIYNWFIDDTPMPQYSGLSSIGLMNLNEKKITVKLTSGDQCHSSLLLEKSVISVQFTNDIRPSRPEVLSTFALCEGESVTMTSTQTHSMYVWSNGSALQSQVVSENGTYTLRVGTSMACLSEPSLPIHVSLGELPIATITFSGNELIASTGTKYIWTLNNEPLDVSTGTITIDKSGAYRVEVFNAAGCSSLSEPMIITTIEKGINADIVTSPNPVSGKLTISSAMPVQRIDIFDLQGRLVFTTNRDTQEIEMGQYPSALYTLIIQSAGRIITRRVVVQH